MKGYTLFLTGLLYLDIATYVSSLILGESVYDYKFLDKPFDLHTYARVGNGGSLPLEYDNTRMYFKRTGDEKYKPGEILVWERFGPNTGNAQYHMIGFESTAFSYNYIYFCSHVKFVDTIPDGFGFLMPPNTVLTSWISRCQVNVWCKFCVALHATNAGSPVKLQFNMNNITQEQQIIHFGGIRVNRVGGTTFPMFQQPYIMNETTIIANQMTPSLPITVNDGTFSVVEDVEDHRFAPGEVFKYEKTGHYYNQWFGVKLPSEYAGSIVAVRFSIKFLETKPDMTGSGIKYDSNDAHNSWHSKCTVDKWCDVLLKINEITSNTMVYLSLYHFPHVKIHIARFAVTIIDKKTVCTTIRRGVTEYNAGASFYTVPTSKGWYLCSEFCRTRGWNQMTLIKSSASSTSSTGTCRCTNGASTSSSSNSIFCENSFTTNKINGVWTEWGAWGSCTHRGIRSVSTRYRACATDVPTANGGMDDCPGGKYDRKICTGSFVHLGDSSTLPSQKPSALTVYKPIVKINYIYTPYFYKQFWTRSSNSDGRADNAFVKITPPVSLSYTVIAVPTNVEILHPVTKLSYGVSSQPNSYYTSSSTHSSVYLQYEIDYKITDNPSTLTPYVSSIIRLYKDGYSDMYHVLQQIVNRLPLDPELRADFDVEATFPPSSIIIPSARPTLVIRMKSKLETISATSITISIAVPPTIDLEDKPVITGTYGTGVFNKEQRTFTWHIPYLEALANSADVNITIRIANDKNEIRTKDYDIKLPMVINYCQIQSCDSSFTLQMKSLTPRLNNVRGQNPLQPYYKGPVRIKIGVKTHYMIVDPRTNQLSCDKENYKANFYTENYEWTSEKGSNKTYGVTNKVEFIESNYVQPTNVTVVFMNDGLFAYNQTDMSINCLFCSGGKDMNRKTQSNIEEIDCEKGKFKLLPGLDKSLNIMYRGMLSTDTNIGDVILVVNPSRNMGASFNCFYTVDLGAKWKGISPMVTNVDFYIKSTDMMYGRCNYGKSYCKFSMTGIDTKSSSLLSAILSIDKTEYHTQRGSIEAAMTLIVDDLAFDDDSPVASSIDETVGVSVRGVYKQNGAAWDRIFAWAE